jgi:hypothetical protein
MRSLRLLALLLCLSGVLPSQAVADAHPFSAIAMLRQCEFVLRREETTDALICLQKAYTVQATIAALKLFSIKSPYCLPSNGWSNEQAIRIFVKYANDHPEVINLAAEYVFILALKTSYPCPQ